METETQNVANQLRIKAFLKKNTLGTLATVGENGSLQLSTLFFIIEDAYVVYFVTKTSTRKYINIARNPNTTILIANAEELTSVEMSGRTEIVTDSKQVLDVITKFQILAQDSRAGYWVPPVSQVTGSQFAVCKFTPDRIEYTQFSGESSIVDAPECISITLTK